MLRAPDALAGRRSLPERQREEDTAEEAGYGEHDDGREGRDVEHLVEVEPLAGHARGKRFQAENQQLVAQYDSQHDAEDFQHAPRSSHT